MWDRQVALNSLPTNQLGVNARTFGVRLWQAKRVSNLDGVISQTAVWVFDLDQSGGAGSVYPHQSSGSARSGGVLRLTLLLSLTL